MDELDKKKIADGEATLRTWFDEGVTDQQLYQVVISKNTGEISTTLPARTSEGTRERVTEIFDSLNEQTSFEDVFERVLQEDTADNS